MMVYYSAQQLKTMITLRGEPTLHIIHSCPLSSIEVQVIRLQSRSLFCNAFKINQTRMCAMERPFIIVICTIVEKDFFFLFPLSFSTNSFFSHSPLKKEQWSVLSRDLAVLTAAEEETKLMSPHSTTLFIWILHIIGIHYSYNQLAHHLLRKII